MPKKDYHALLSGSIDIYELMKLNEAKGHYFFSKDTMHFFRSKVLDDVVACDVRATEDSPFWKDRYTSGDAYFITSEKNIPSRFVRAEFGSRPHPRKYSIRKMNMKTGDVSTVGEFQQFGSARQAKRALREIAEGCRRTKVITRRARRRRM